MRLDLPMCDMKDCRHYLDGNCSIKNRFLTCNYTMKRFQLENSNGNWNTYSFPKMNGFYKCLLLDSNTLTTTIENIEYKNNEFYFNIKEKVFLGWKDGD